MSQIVASERNFMLPVGRIAFPQLFKPKAAKNSTREVYSCALFYPAGIDLSEVKDESKRLLVQCFGEDYVQAVKDGRVKWPFKTATSEDEKWGIPKGSILLRSNSQQRPGVVDRYQDPATGKARVITDPSEIYAGMQVKALVRPFYFKHEQGGRGISLGLQAVQKWADDERIDGRIDASNAFPSEEAPAADIPTAASMIGDDGL